MAVTKEIIRECIRDKRDEIENAEVVFRPFEFEDNGNYVFVGVRHVGKSYVLFQRVKQLLASGIGWDEILFVDFEDERLSELESSDLNLLLETHLETYGKKPYIFLDEIQNISGWDKFVRRLANAKYHIYVTGSNAKMLSKDVATTLGGRFFITDVYPYSFSEYLHACDIELKDDWIHSTIERSAVVRAFNEFFYFGGLPEIREYKNKRKMLSSLYQKIYLGDICARNSIRNDRMLNILIKKMAESVKQPISFNRLKNVVVSTGYKISMPTVMDYVGYAADSWLVLPVENELSKLSDKESNKKYYFIDNGLLNLFLIDPETSLLENVVAVQLCRLYGRENVYVYR
jgi:predicted AAA+ superfamily ATPase